MADVSRKKRRIQLADSVEDQSGAAHRARKVNLQEESKHIDDGDSVRSRRKEQMRRQIEEEEMSPEVISSLENCPHQFCFECIN